MTGFLGRSIVRDPLYESYRRRLRLRSVPALARLANSLWAASCLAEKRRLCFPTLRATLLIEPVLIILVKVLRDDFIRCFLIHAIDAGHKQILPFKASSPVVILHQQLTHLLQSYLLFPFVVQVLVVDLVAVSLPLELGKLSCLIPVLRPLSIQISHR